MQLEEKTRIIASDFFSLTGRPISTMTVEEYLLIRNTAKAEEMINPEHDVYSSRVSDQLQKAHHQEKGKEAHTPSAQTMPDIIKPKTFEKENPPANVGLSMLQAVNG